MCGQSSFGETLKFEKKKFAHRCQNGVSIQSLAEMRQVTCVYLKVHDVSKCCVCPALPPLLDCSMFK